MNAHIMLWTDFVVVLVLSLLSLSPFLLYSHTRLSVFSMNFDARASVEWVPEKARTPLFLNLLFIRIHTYITIRGNIFVYKYVFSIRWSMTRRRRVDVTQLLLFKHSLFYPLLLRRKGTALAFRCLLGA